MRNELAKVASGTDFRRDLWKRLAEDEVCATQLTGFSRSTSHGDLASRGIIPAVLDEISVFVDEFQVDPMFAANPTGQPDRFPLVDELRFTVVNSVTDAKRSAIALQLGVRKPEIDHDRIGVFAFVLAFGAAVSKQSFSWINGAGITRGKVLSFASGRRAGA